jgi:hypothetical protein
MSAEPQLGVVARGRGGGRLDSARIHVLGLRRVLPLLLRLVSALLRVIIQEPPRYNENTLVGCGRVVGVAVLCGGGISLGPPDVC